MRSNRSGVDQFEKGYDWAEKNLSPNYSLHSAKRRLTASHHCLRNGVVRDVRLLLLFGVGGRIASEAGTSGFLTAILLDVEIDRFLH